MSRPRRRPVLAAVVVFGLAVAVTAATFAGLVDAVFGAAAAQLYVLAQWLPVVGITLVTAVLYAAWQTESPRTDVFGDREAETVEADAKLVGTNIGRQLDNAAAAWYHCEENYSTVEVTESLTESAVRAVRTSHGLDEEGALGAVEAGTWTDDPVAAAFLSPECTQPLFERLRTVLDPGRAFHRRVERTVGAIEDLERRDHDRTGSAADAGTGTSREVPAE